ncbi:carboxypeptidase-like regulatory domain-containing protein [Mucilaginibacter calamicampi]|uniref:Carboxypeptidase-like regulatory domain-containing protein n=1 Tax=Mucilaginibacter calamicampi TaxID=1302352 RepID=A0ABW2YXT5_9SPHI
MLFRWFAFLFIMLPAVLLGQNLTINGKIVNKESSRGVAGASVFLSNSSFGTTSSSDGTFTLSRLRPGQYTLVVTAIGYAVYNKIIMVNADVADLTITMEPRAIMLREVTISGSSRANWNRNYEMFKKDFIGNDENAKQCVVINPKVLDFTYRKSKQTLIASADEFLIVENKALGYRVKFLLNSFSLDNLEQRLTYQGSRLFEELPGSAAQKKKWLLKRDRAYYGSAMHFLRSLYQNKLKEEGFEMRKLTRESDPSRPSAAVIQQKMQQFNGVSRDSFQYYHDFYISPRYIHQKISTVPWLSFEVLRDGPQPGLYAITFPQYLYVIYKNREETEAFKDIYRPLDMPNYEVSVLTLFNDPPYALFDSNGIVVGESPLFEGAWSKARLSELLPVDYTPSAPLN